MYSEMGVELSTLSHAHLGERVAGARLQSQDCCHRPAAQQHVDACVCFDCCWEADGDRLDVYTYTMKAADQLAPDAMVRRRSRLARRSPRQDVDVAGISSEAFQNWLLR